MLGFLGRFGRAEALRRLDAALRAVDLHPALVPEAVKLTAVRRLKAAGAWAGPEPEAAAARLLGYCLMGAEAFSGANGTVATASVEARIEAAAARGEGLDAEIVLLALHAGLVQPEVIRRFDLAAELPAGDAAG